MPTQNDPIAVFRYYNMQVGQDECWVWAGPWGGQSRERRPYFMAGRRRQIAYRWVYELVHGVTLTPDQPILHSCDNGGHPIGCGNPAHLRLGTREENTNDMMSRERHGLPKTVVRAIRTLLEQGKTQEEIANVYGIARTTVSAIATGRSHKPQD
jgi:DNA-binding XRE family transcriptional regulator